MKQKPNKAAQELAKKRWDKVKKKDRIDQMKKVRSFGKQKPVIHKSLIDERTLETYTN